MGTHRLACERGEVVDDRGYCAHPPRTSSRSHSSSRSRHAEKAVAEFRASRQRSDGRILHHIRDQLADLISRQQQALQDVKAYLPRAESRDEARVVVDALRNVDADVRAYLAELKLCDQDARITTREHLVRCANRRGIARRLDALEERAHDSFDLLEDALEPLQSTWRTVKDWTASAFTLGARLLKTLGLFLLKHWKIVAGSVFVAWITFPSISELLGIMIGKLDGLDSPLHAIIAMMKAVFYTFCSAIGQGMVIGFIYLAAYFIVGNADALIDMGASMSKSMVGWVSGAGKFVETLATRLKTSISEYGGSLVLAITIAAVMIMGPILDVLDCLTRIMCYTHNSIDDAIKGISQFTSNAWTGFASADEATQIPQLEKRANVHALRILLDQLRSVMGLFTNFGQNFSASTTLPADTTFVDDAAFTASFNAFAKTGSGKTLNHVLLPNTGYVQVALAIKSMHTSAAGFVGTFLKSSAGTAALGYLVWSFMSLAYVFTSGSENDDLVQEVSRMAAHEAHTVQFVDVERDTPLTAAEADLYFPMDQTSATTTATAATSATAATTATASTTATAATEAAASRNSFGAQRAPTSTRNLWSGRARDMSAGQTHTKRTKRTKCRSSLRCVPSTRQHTNNFSPRRATATAWQSKRLSIKRLSTKRPASCRSRVPD